MSEESGERGESGGGARRGGRIRVGMPVYTAAATSWARSRPSSRTACGWAAGASPPAPWSASRTAGSTSSSGGRRTRTPRSPRAAPGTSAGKPLCLMTWGAIPFTPPGGGPGAGPGPAPGAHTAPPPPSAPAWWQRLTGLLRPSTPGSATANGGPHPAEAVAANGGPPPPGAAPARATPARAAPARGGERHRVDRLGRAAHRLPHRLGGVPAPGGGGERGRPQLRHRPPGGLRAQRPAHPQRPPGGDRGAPGGGGARRALPGLRLRERRGAQLPPRHPPPGRPGPPGGAVPAPRPRDRGRAGHRGRRALPAPGTPGGGGQPPHGHRPPPDQPARGPLPTPTPLSGAPLPAPVPPAPPAPPAGDGRSWPRL